MAIKCKKLYEWREKKEVCDGKDLCGFFYRVLGDPSPSGERKISIGKARRFVRWANRRYNRKSKI
jgi:hypothetical protein